MKKNLFLMVAFIAGVCVITSCGSKKAAVSPAVESKIKSQPSLEGDKVMVETTKLQGIDMVDDLSEDGLSMRKVAYKWYAGIGKANDKQTAVEFAEREARTTISRIVETMVLDQAERGSLTNNGETQKALTSHWKQVSRSIQNACEPFGETKIEYSPSTKMYTATAKVGMRGDKFQQLLNNAGNFKPTNLSGKELDDFINVNKAIMEAAQGK